MASPVRAVHPAGQRALLLDLKSLDDVLALYQHLLSEPLAGQTDLVAAARTVLIRFSTAKYTADAQRRVKKLKVPSFDAGQTQTVEIDVVYDGEDLDAVAEHLGISPGAVADWHSGQEWTAAFGGFSPGFAYCVRPPESRGRSRFGRRAEAAQSIPRRQEPRTAVPAGSVAVAGEYSAVYPSSSPGGWQLIGHTSAVLWDVDRVPPGLIRPGDVVRYRPVRHQALVTAGEGGPPDSGVADPGPPDPGAQRPPLALGGPARPLRRGAAFPAPPDVVFDVVGTGPQTLLQDLGRPGFSNLGVPASGAADRASARQANQLAGNDDGATVLEVLYGGLQLRARQTAVLTVTGAEAEICVTSPVPAERSNTAAPTASTSRTEARDVPESDSSAESNGLKGPQHTERSVPMRAPFWIFPGETVRLGAPEAGVRSYVAASGGFAAVEHLGSAAADTLSGIGPDPVQAEDELALAGAASRFVGIASVARTPLPEPDSPTRVRFVPGPRQEWFGQAGLRQLTGQEWRVSQDSDRVGIRFSDPALPGGPEGPQADAPGPLVRAKEGELPSEGMVRGAVQVPPAGLPVLFVADHPVTGGYPVIGVVVREDLPLAAQLAPGNRVRFVAVDGETLQPL